MNSHPDEQQRLADSERNVEFLRESNRLMLIALDKIAKSTSCGAPVLRRWATEALRTEAMRSGWRPVKEEPKIASPTPVDENGETSMPQSSKLSLKERREIERVVWEHAIRTAAQILDSEYAPDRGWLKDDNHPHSEPARLVWEKLLNKAAPRSEWLQQNERTE